MKIGRNVRIRRKGSLKGQEDRVMTMKRLLLTVAITGFVGCGVQAQNIAINDDGSNPDGSAMLDISASSGDLGILIPRVQLDDKTNTAPVSSPADGLLIYNQSGSEPEGFYFWEGGASEWVQLYSSAADDDDWDRDAGNGYLYPSNIGDNVGVGTNSPGYQLEVDGGSISLTSGSGDILAHRTSSRFHIFGNTTSKNGPAVEFFGDSHSSRPGDLSLVAGDGGGAGEGEIRFWDYDAGNDTWQENMTITDAGEVGIGTSTPSDTLEVDAQAYIQGDNDVANTTSKIDLAIDDDDTGMEVPEDGKLKLMADNDSILVLDNKGTKRGFDFNPHERGLDLRIRGQNSTELIRTEAADNNVGMGTSVSSAPDGASSSRLVIEQKSDGAAALGLVAPGEGENWELNVDNSGYDDLNFAYDGTIEAYVDDADGSWNRISDKRFKTDIRKIGSVIPKIRKLEPVSFILDKGGLRSNDGNKDKRYIGFVAQEMNKYFPRIARKKGGRYFMSYSKIGVVAIKALQEQQEMIEALREKVEGNGTNSQKEKLRQELEQHKQKNQALQKELETIKERLKELEKAQNSSK